MKSYSMQLVSKHFVTAALLSLFFAHPASATEAIGEGTAPCKKGEFGKHFSSSPHLQKELNLTEKQKEQVKLVHSEFATSVENKTKTMKDLNEALVTLLQTPDKGPQTKAALLEKFKKYQAARNELYLAKFEMALKTRELLSEEQIKKYKAFYKPEGGKHSK